MFRFKLDSASHVPFYRQIVELVLGGISSGAIQPGEQLPTIRDLAVRLGVNPNTVAKAYRELHMLGALDTQQGTGVFARAKRADRRSARQRQHATEALCRDFISRAQLLGITLDQLIQTLQDLREQQSNPPGDVS
ncbi:MAG: GntR family transcriptional regulator [Phycisphaeraceae bacterium]